MADIKELKDKLKTGKNESTDGFQKFASAQFYENITSEQYAGAYRPKLTIFSATRDALNPKVNTTKLRNRLWVIDHYRYRYGAQHTFWLHAAMNKYGTHLWKYKFNYGVKALAAFAVFSSIQTYKLTNEENFLSEKQRAMLASNTVIFSGVFTGLCLVI